MNDLPAAGAAPAPPLDPRLRQLLHDLPEVQAAVVEALVRERDGLVALAERRAERLQRLQEISATLARSLDRDEIERELARQVARMIRCAGVVVARPNEGAPGAAVALHWRNGDEHDLREPTPAGAAIGEVALTARPSRAVPVAPASPPAGAGEHTAAVLAVPLMVGYRLAGIVAVYGETTEEFGSEEEELLQTMGATAATALVNANLFAESLREKRQSEALAALAASLGSSLRLSDALRLSLRHSRAILGAEGAAVALRRGEFLHIVATEGSMMAAQGLYIPVAESAVGRAMLDGRSLILNAIAPGDRVYHRAREAAGVEKVVAAPMVTPEGPIGLLAVTNREQPFTDEEARVLQRLASQLALAVVNARLYEEASELTRELSVAFDAIAGGLAVLDGDGFVLRHNAGLATLAGEDGSASLVGRALYQLLLHEPREVTDDDPLGSAIRGRRVGRGSLRQEWSGRWLDLVASPHPAGGAVVTVDDVTTLRSLAERYRLVVESTTDAILITGRDGTIEFGNDAAADLFAQPGPLVGLRLPALGSPETESALLGQLALAVGGEAHRFVGEVCRPQGERRTVSISLSPIRGGGPVSGLVVSLRDVTDETRARDEVEAANARYRHLFESAADAIYTLDTQGTATSANASAESMAGVARNELIGRDVMSFVDPSEVATVTAHFVAALAGETRRYEAHLIRADGKRRLVSVSNTPIRHGDSVVGVLGVVRDLTDDRDRAERLERAEARYTRLVESAEDAICTVDEEGNFSSVNRALERVMGRTREALLGTHFTELVAPDQRPAIWRMLAATLRGERQREELRFAAADGAARVATIISAPLYEQGRVTGALAILRDVTEERALLEQVVRREKLAALGELVGGVAHEVNTPLTGILAFAQLLQSETKFDAETREAIDTIVSETKRAARIVGKLLTFARQNPPERLLTDLNQVLLDTIELRRYPLKMQQITLTTDLAASLPSTWADPFQLQQVFINLLSNAEQALADRAGERRITVRTQVQGDSLVATVADTGHGIAPEHLARIFNPFYTTKPRGIGTGLGLSISFGIVREHGGTMRVRSEPGRGAEFDVVLPISGPPTTPSSK